MSAAVADKLRDARALIERGWTRRAYCRDGRYCLSGALKKAFTGSATTALRKSDDPEILEMKRIITTVLEDGVPSYRFNDAQSSKKPVLALLDRAIELAEKSA